MRIYYISLKGIIKKAAQVIIIFLVLLLMLKIVQYNLFRSVMSNFDPNQLTIGNIL
ncbi:MAG TPA: hypothetical protein VNT57_01770 [Desulfobacteria bacterium]|nr:hypothetical protein [Desulfobacteria bacterium]